MMARARSPARAAASETFCSSFLATRAWPISIAAAPIASNATIKTATITAVAPRELLSGSRKRFIHVLLMTHHRLCLDCEWVRNPGNNSRNPANEKGIRIGRCHSQSVGIAQPRAYDSEGDGRGIDTGIGQITIGDRDDLSRREL